MSVIIEVHRKAAEPVALHRGSVVVCNREHQIKLKMNKVKLTHSGNTERRLNMRHVHTASCTP